MSSAPIDHPQRHLSDPNVLKGIVGLVVAFFVPPIGLPVSIVAKRRSAAEGFQNQWATAGMYVGCATLIMWLLVPVATAFG